MAKPSRRRDDFSNRLCLMQQFKYHFEDLEEYDHPRSEDYDDKDVYNIPNPHQAILKYLKQIRSNFGFDLNCRVPTWFDAPLVWVDLADAKVNEVTLYESVMKACEVAICEINEEMGKSYEFVEVLNSVLSITFNHRLTIAVTDAGDGDAGVITIQAIVYEDVGFKFTLEQWRFKPAETSTPAPLPYDGVPYPGYSIHDTATGAVVTSTSIPEAATGAVVTLTSIPEAATGAVVTLTSIPEAATGAVVTLTSIPEAATGAVVTLTSIPEAATGAVVTSTSIPEAATGAVVTSTSIPDAVTDAVVTSTSTPAPIPDAATGAVVTSTSITDAATSTADADADATR